MRRAKQIIVGCRMDALSMIYRARVREALGDANPHTEFVDFREPSSRRVDARKAAAAMIQRLSKGEMDIAVMDARWIPLQLAGTLEIGAILERTNPYDALISCENLILDEQPENTRIVAGEAVERGQLLYYRSDLRLVDGDDEFESLFAAMNRGAIEAFVFPASDVETLNKQEHVVEVFTTSICTPVAGQGAVALLARRDRKDVLSMLRDLNDASAAAEVELERMFLERVAKDGRVPVGVLGNVEGNGFEIEAAIAAPDGSEKISGTVGGALADRSRAVGKLADELLTAGGDDIIASFRKLRWNG
jgi:hydroxymethylbilane synthase